MHESMPQFSASRSVPEAEDFAGTNLGASGQVCWPLAILPPSEGRGDRQFDVFPNPSSTIFYIKNKTGKIKELYNVLGELLLVTNKDEIEVRHFARGVYYLRCEGESKKVIVE